MTRKPEVTGKAVARGASRILAYADQFVPDQEFYIRRKTGTAFRLSVAEVVSMAGSLVTQAADHADRETLRNGELPRGHRVVRKGKPVTRNHRART